jgi:hypothetical protein
LSISVLIGRRIARGLGVGLRIIVLRIIAGLCIALRVVALLVVLLLRPSLLLGVGVIGRCRPALLRLVLERRVIVGGTTQLGRCRRVRIGIGGLPVARLIERRGGLVSCVGLLRRALLLRGLRRPSLLRCGRGMLMRCGRRRLIALELRSVARGLRIARLFTGLGLCAMSRLFGVGFGRMAITRRRLTLLRVAGIQIIAFRCFILAGVRLPRMKLRLGRLGVRIGLLMLRMARLIRARRCLTFAWLWPPRGGVRWCGVSCHDLNIPSPHGQKKHLRIVTLPHCVGGLDA